jgi:NitT/TauT family transport system permease protein
MMRQTVIQTLSIACLGVIWEILAFSLHSRYLPFPSEVLGAFVSELASGALGFHLGVTLLRVAASFAISMGLGCAIGLFLGRNAKANLFFDPWLFLALNLPALVAIVFCYLWIGINESAAVAAVALNKIPSTAVIMREGARALDPDLEEVARVFQYSGWRNFRNFMWPQLQPFVATAIRSGLSLIWKIVLIVELIGRSNGVGFQINLYFAQFDLAHILVYALSFMAIIWLIEMTVVKPWEARARIWRGVAE